MVRCEIVAGANPNMERLRFAVRGVRFTLPADLNDLLFRRFGNSRNVEVPLFRCRGRSPRRLLRKSQVGNAGKQLNNLRQTRMIPAR